MSKYRSLILLLLMSAVILTPFKLPSCPKQRVDASVSYVVSPCAIQQVLASSCSAISYWLQEDGFDLYSSLIAQSLLGLLSFLLVFTKYTSPLDEIFRPPMRS